MKHEKAIRRGPALQLAILRAIEAYQPERQRLFDDRFSRRLLSRWWALFLHRPLCDAIIALMEAYTPGLIGSVYCRTRYIDDALYTALESGFSQVVLLGAGFDSRAYRIRGIERAHVFELDHPTMQCVKQQRVAKLLGALPAYTTFASIDFERQNLGEILTAVGWHPDRKTFFIWEGVTQYLQAEAVDRTFRWISCAAATGSVIVFTYVDQGSIDRTACSDAAQKILVAMHQAGTPWISGLDSSRLSHYLIERGLELVEQVGAPDYRARYLKPHGRRMSIFEGERVVLARVVGAASGKKLRNRRRCAVCAARALAIP